MLAAFLLLAGASSAQLLFSLQRMSEPRALMRLPTITIVRGDAPPPPPDAGPADFKQQLQARNGECYQQCANEFETAAGSADACERGCRLFALAESKQPQQDAGSHRDKCAKDCETAYPVPVEQHSCQSGCRHQRPKQQESGAPVVMSVVRKFSFDSTGDQDVQRSQSTMLVHDGDKMRVIEGPAQMSVTRHGDGGPAQGQLPDSLDAMVKRMRDVMHRLMGLRSEDRAQQAEPLTQPEQLAEPTEDVMMSSGLQPERSAWTRVWHCTSHYVLLALLLLATALVLYCCYCFLIMVRRSRIGRRQDLLVQDEEVAEDLPPKYVLAVAAEGELEKRGDDKDLPPAYAAIVAEAQIPPKLDV